MNGSSACRAVVVDESCFLQPGLAAKLPAHLGITVIATFGPLEARAELYRLDANLILLGPGLPDYEALPLCRLIAREVPASRVVIISPDARDVYFQMDAMQAGARGCLPADIDETSFAAAIHAILRGYRLTPDEFVICSADQPSFTLREQQVLHHLARGAPASRIAKNLLIAKGTVRNHIQRIFDKLGAHTRAAAVGRARRLEWLRPSDARAGSSGCRRPRAIG